MRIDGDIEQRLFSLMRSKVINIDDLVSHCYVQHLKALALFEIYGTKTSLRTWAGRSYKKTQNHIRGRLSNLCNSFFGLAFSAQVDYEGTEF